MSRNLVALIADSCLAVVGLEISQVLGFAAQLQYTVIGPGGQARLAHDDFHQILNEPVKKFSEKILRNLSNN